MIISVHQGIPRLTEWLMAKPVDFELAAEEHIAIVGPNAGGKSMLIDILTGAHPLMGERVEYDFTEGCSPSCQEEPPRSRLASTLCATHKGVRPRVDIYPS